MPIPEADLLIHAGDFCSHGSLDEVYCFLDWFASLPHAHKVAIPGNHDKYVEANPQIALEFRDRGVELLIHEGTVVEGLRLWGSPATPWFYDWAWNYQRGPEIAAVWAGILDDTDVLITHGPPRGILDRCPNGAVGCADLLRRVLEVRPLAHVFGHIHEGYGQLNKDGTLYVNAAVCNGRYHAVNRPQVFEL